MTLRRAPVERLAAELLEHYAIESPPVPVEAILQYPGREMWREVDMSLLGAPLRSNDPVALRLALACLLARLLAASVWGQARGLAGVDVQPEDVERLARAVLMPRSMLLMLPAGALDPAKLSRMFEVPREEARRRLIELDAIIP